MWDYLKNESILNLKGIGDKKSALLNKLGIKTVYDLIFYYPRTYKQYPVPSKISSLREGINSVYGVIIKKEFSTPYRNIRKRYLKITVKDKTGIVILIAFKKRALFLNSSLKRGDNVYVYGRFYNASDTMETKNFEITKTDFIPEKSIILPVYTLKEKTVGQKFLRKIIKYSLNKYNYSECEYNSVIDEKKFISPEIAIKEIHFPASLINAEKARKTFALIRLLKWNKQSLEKRIERMKYKINPIELKQNNSIKKIESALPFKFTKSQKSVLTEIYKDLSKDYPMDRLIQGDVGTGKTIVAIMAIAAAIGRGGTGAFLAPTEILCQQTYWNFKDILSKYNINTGILHGSLTNKEKKDVRDQLETGEIDIIFGTHSLLTEKTKFKDLKIVVIDEEHRFGLQQKLRLILRDIKYRPHFIVMTATPIPRTCAMVLYGGMDISFLMDMPFGKRDVNTLMVKKTRKKELYKALKREINRNRSVYYICPYINKDDEKGKGVKAVAKELIKLGFSVKPLYGSMASDDKKKVLDGFKRNEFSILVSTTVVEVGIDVHNAGVIVIDNPERFGLSQLHQLRGRVGRDGQKGYCILFYNDDLNTESLKRLRAFTKNDDGYYVSIEDLKNRGPGEIEGNIQKGFHWMYPFEPSKDEDLLNEINKINN